MDKIRLRLCIERLRRKLNGMNLVDQEQLQATSRRLDQLIVRYQRMLLHEATS